MGGDKNSEENEQQELVFELEGESKVVFIDETHLNEDEVKDHYRHMSISAWDSWNHYRNEMEKILYFGTTLFLTIISATGLFSVFASKEIFNTFHLYHVLVFHSIFLLIFLAYAYKRLICDISFAFAHRADEYYQKRFKQPMDNKFVFISVKNRFTKNGRWLLKSFNVAIVMIYLIITSVPFIRANENGVVEMRADFIIVLIVFLILFGVLFIFSEREIKKVKKSMNQDWVNHRKKMEI